MADNEFVTAFDEAWRPFRTAVGELAAAGRLGERTPGGWRVKGMLAHIAFWDESTQVVIETMLRGGPFPADWPGFASGYEAPDDGTWPDADVHNAREAEWGDAQPDDVVVQRLDTAYQQARSVLAGITPDEVADDRFRSYVEGEKTAHYLNHIRELHAVAQAEAQAPSV